MSTRYNKSGIFKAAWAYIKNNGFGLSEAMKLVWSYAKANRPLYQNPDDEFDRDYGANLEEVAILAEKLSIPEAFDTIEGVYYEARAFFDPSKHSEEELIWWRRNLQEAIAIDKPRLVCPVCQQMIKISGHRTLRGKVRYFAHYKDSKDCPYKTSTGKSKKEIEILKYSLVGQSERHKQLKGLIQQALCGEASKELGVTNVECEKNIKSRIPYLNYRRPDVCAEWNGRHLVFELQLSTTFVSVIVERDIFYRLNGYDIIWVFNFDDNAEYVNLYNLVCKDIYYANKRNVFIFDYEAQRLSVKRGELVLKCRWLDEDNNWSQDKIITLADLQFDDEYHKPYIYDADADYFRKYPEAFERRRRIENTKQYLLNAILEREEREKQEIADAKEQLKNNDESVEPFKEKTKYGFKYNGKIILPPKYTSVNKLESGYFEVGFSRKKGLVSRKGEEIVPVEYIDITIVDTVYDIVLARGKGLDLFVRGNKICMKGEFNIRRGHIKSNNHSNIIDFLIEWNKYGEKDTLLFKITQYDQYVYVELCTNTKFVVTVDNVYGLGEILYNVPIGADDLFIATDSELNKKGIIDFSGHNIVDFTFADLRLINHQYILYTLGELWGIMNSYGEKYSECFAKDLRYLGKNLFAYSNSEKWGVSDEFGKLLCEEKFTYIELNGDSTLTVSFDQGDTYNWSSNDGIASYRYRVNGFLSTLAGEIIYNEALFGNYKVRTSGGFSSLLSPDNNVLIDYENDYSGIFGLNDENIAVKLGNKFSLFNYRGERLTDFKFSSIEYNEEKGNFNVVDEYGRRGVIDNNGNVIPIVIEENNNYRILDKFGKSCMESIDGNVLIDFENYYSGIFRLTDEYVSVKQNYKFSLFNYFGEQLTGFEFSSIEYNEKEGNFNVVKGEKRGTIDKGGNVIPVVIEENSKHRILDKLGKLCLEDTNCNMLLDYEYNSIENIYDDIYILSKEGYYYLYRSDKHSMSERYRTIKYLQGDCFIYGVGYSELRIGNGEGPLSEGYKDIKQVDDEHYIAISCKITYETYYGTEYRNTYVKPDYRWGRGGWERMPVTVRKTRPIENLKSLIIDEVGNKYSKYIFDSISDFTDGVAKAVLNGKKGKIDMNGNLLEEKIRDTSYGKTLYLKFEQYYFKDANSEIISPMFEEVELLTEGLYKVKLIEDKKDIGYRTYSIITNELSTSTYKTISDFQDGRAKVISYRGKEWEMDKNGNLVEEKIFDVAKAGALYLKLDQYYFKDANSEIISPMFEEVEPLTEGLYKVILVEDASCKYKAYSVVTNETSSSSFDDILDLKDRLLLAKEGQFVKILNGVDIIDFGQWPMGFTNVKVLDDFYFGLEISKQGPSIWRPIHKWGVGTLSGEIVIDFILDECPKLENDNFVSVINGKDGVLDKKGIQLPTIIEVADNYRILEKFGKYGLEDMNKNMLIGFENNYSVITKLTDTTVLVKKDSMFSIFNHYGKQITRFEYSSIIYNAEKDNFDVIEDNGFHGTLDNNGNAVPILIEETDNYRILEKFGKYALEDTNGDVLIDFDNNYSRIYKLTDEHISIIKEGKFALFNFNGKQLTEFEYSSIEYNEDEDNFNVVKGKIKGKIDNNGRVVPIVFEANDNYRIMGKFGKCGMEDTNGDVIIDFDNEYSGIFRLSDEFVSVKKGDKYALFDFHGDRLTEFEYSSINYDEKEDDFDVTKYGGARGVIDKTGVAIDSDRVGIYGNQYVIFKRFEKYGVRSKEGVEALPSVYDMISVAKDDVVITERNKDWALFSCTGERLTNRVYNHIEIKDGQIYAERNKSKGMLNTDGSEAYTDKPVSKGYKIRTQFNVWSIVSPDDELTLTGEYASIQEITEGVFAIQKDSSLALASYDTIQTLFIYKKLVYLSDNYIAASKMVSKTTKTRRTGWGYSRGSYTYWDKRVINQEKWGVIDTSGKVIFSFKSDVKPDYVDGKLNMQVNSKHVSYTLGQLKGRRNRASNYEIDKEYNAVVKGFSRGGVIVKIGRGQQFILMRTLKVTKGELSRGDKIKLIFKGIDDNGYMKWELNRKA